MEKEEKQPEFHASTFLNSDFEPSFLHPNIEEEEMKKWIETEGNLENRNK